MKQKRRGREGAVGESHKKKWGGWEGKKKWVMQHLPLDTLPGGNQSEWLSKNDRDA